MNIRRSIALLLSLCLIISVLPLTARAAYTPMNYSPDLIEFIKANEGFQEFATWDYAHWSIGYGTQCEKNEYPNGITQEEAELLLCRFITEEFSPIVNAFCKANGMQPTQNQFDCMVSLTYNLGSSWMNSGYSLPRLMLQGCTELQLLNVMGDWVNAGGQPLDGLIFRRMRENYIYFHGIYNCTQSIDHDVPYACLRFDAAGGLSDFPRLYTFRGSPYGLEQALPSAIRAGYRFAGWFDVNGNQITNDTIATSVLTTATARWVKDQLSVFTDVYATDWFFADVKTAAEAGIFNGYTDGSFRPYEQMSRAMFAQVLYRMQGSPRTDCAIPFKDVSASAWYYDAVRWAYQASIVKGVSATAFSPDSPITREQMATMLYNFSGYYGIDAGAQHKTLQDFADAGSISGFAQTAMQWAVGIGLINGTGGSLLSPKGVATRSQAASVLVRLSGLIRKGVA